MGTGPLPFCIVYFIYRKEWQRRNCPENKEKCDARKVLSRTWENKIDWWTFLVCIGSAAFQVVIFVSVILAFKFARLAGLNIGIITAIWSFIPFMVAAIERVVYGISIKLY